MLKYIHHIVRPAMKETSLNTESSKKDAERTNPIGIAGLKQVVHDLLTLPGGCDKQATEIVKKVLEQKVEVKE